MVVHTYHAITRVVEAGDSGVCDNPQSTVSLRPAWLEESLCREKEPIVAAVLVKADALNLLYQLRK